MNLLSEIKENILPKKLDWLNEPQNWSAKNNSLIVIPHSESDYFNDPETGSIMNTGHYLYTIVEGDFDLTTRVSVDMINTFDSGCLLIHYNDSMWAKLCYENWMDAGPSIVSVVTKLQSDDCPSLRIGKVKPYLKILRSGNCFGFFYSLDNKDWTLIRYFYLDIPQEIKVGLVAQAPVKSGCTITFDFMDLEFRKVDSVKYL